MPKDQRPPNEQDLELSDDPPDPELEQLVEKLPPDHGLRAFKRAKARQLMRQKLGPQKNPPSE